MAITALETHELETLSMLPISGHIELLPLKKYLPHLLINIKTNPQYTAWKIADIDSAKLAAALKSITTSDIIKHIDLAEHMDFFGRLKENKHVESDNYFIYDQKYAVVFSKMIEQFGLGNPEIFWQMWKDYNQKAMTTNTSFLYFNHKTSKVEETTKNDQNTYYSCASFSLKHNPEISETQIVNDIWEGAEYRAKRNYAAFLRELYTLSWFTDEHIDPETGKVYAPLRVFVHPLLDIVCRADAVIVPENKTKMGLVALAVYLSSGSSTSKAEIKANNIPGYFKKMIHNIISVGIPIESSAMRSGKVILPSEAKLLTVRKGIEGNKSALEELTDAYTCRNSELMVKT